MEIPFLEPGQVPLPPGEVRVLSLDAEPYPDGRRVRVRLKLTPFLERPNIEIELRDPHDLESGCAAIIESVDATLNMTLHLRQDPQSGTYRAVATVIYPEVGAVDTAEAAFLIQVGAHPPPG